MIIKKISNIDEKAIVADFHEVLDYIKNKPSESELSKIKSKLTKYLETIDGVEMSDRLIDLFTYAVLTTKAFEENEVVDVDKCKTDIKSLLEEIRMSGVGDNIVKGGIECIKSDKEPQRDVLKYGDYIKMINDNKSA